jgi:hypothetical protein
MTDCKKKVKYIERPGNGLPSCHCCLSDMERSIHGLACKKCGAVSQPWDESKWRHDVALLPMTTILFAGGSQGDNNWPDFAYYYILPRRARQC